MNSNPKKEWAIGTFTVWLISPHQRLIDDELRQNSRLLSALLLTSIIVACMLIALAISYDPRDLKDPRIYASGGIVFACMLTYMLNRFGGFVNTSISLFIAFLTIAFIGIPYIGTFPSFMPFAVVPMILAGMFFSFRRTTFLIVLIIGTIFMINTFAPDEAIWERRVMWYFLVFAGGLVFAFKYHLNALAAIRRERIKTMREQGEQHRLELALEKERGELLRTLMSNISHDIKTPLSMINISLYTLERLTDLDKRQEKINSIQSQVHLLESFVQDLMAVARLEGTPKLKLTLTDVNQLIIDIESDMQPIIERKSLQCELKLDEALTPMLIDQTDMRRAISNLIENACHYTPEGGTVTVRTQMRDNNAVITVADTGIGIHEAELPQIFTRFYRADRGRKMVGTGSGLGLAIVQRVTEMHDGRIEVDSKVDKGTIFTLALPYRNTISTAHPEPQLVTELPQIVTSS